MQQLTYRQHGEKGKKMTATLYIIKDADGYGFGRDPVVRLQEPECMSRAWIRKATVALPDGFEVAESRYGEKFVYRGDQQYEVSTDKNGAPVIIDHTNSGAYIRMDVLAEGWDET